MRVAGIETERGWRVIAVGLSLLSVGDLIGSGALRLGLRPQPRSVGIRVYPCASVVNKS